MTSFHPSYNPAEQPFCRNIDPETSAYAARTRSRKVTDAHYFVLRHHLLHQDSDRNAGIAAEKAGLVPDWETGRRASRSVREDMKWTTFLFQGNGKPETVKNLGSNKPGKRNRITEEGSAALLSSDVDKTDHLHSPS